MSVVEPSLSRPGDPSSIRPAGVAPHTSRTEQWAWWLAVSALCLGALLWAASALGLDPTNIPQRRDFETFHGPAIRRFANEPFLTALADYPAAPFPLFYLLSAGVARATGSELAVRLWSVALGLGLLACTYLLGRRRFGAGPLPLLLVAVVLLSPYFRGQTVYANTDVLALTFAAASWWLFEGRAAGAFGTRSAAALVLAFLAFYTRQFYLFVPLYLLVRLLAECSWRGRVGALGLCAVLSVPVLALVWFWGGVTPARFAVHARPLEFPDAAATVILVLGFYCLPLAFTSMVRLRGELGETLRRPAFRVLAAAWALVAGALVLGGKGVPDVEGGGLPLHALALLPDALALRSLVFAAAVFAAGCYLTYLVAQRPLHHSLLVLLGACFLPTNILYQRYFDPLVPLVLAGVLLTRELAAGAAKLTLVAMLGLELVVASIGFVHYRRVFAPSRGAFITPSRGEMPHAAFLGLHGTVTSSRPPPARGTSTSDSIDGGRQAPRVLGFSDSASAAERSTLALGDSIRGSKQPSGAHAP